MNRQMLSALRVDSPGFPTLPQWKGLRLLYEAWIAARGEGQDVWQFAVEIDQFRALDLSHTELRCLLCWGYLEHARERTAAGSRRRSFEPLSTLVLPKRTCFVLTAKGQEAAKMDAEKVKRVFASVMKQTEAQDSLREVPRWNSASRELCWGNYLIKQFRLPAVNQETVLAALEEEGWPLRIDDPLPQTPDIDPKVRLHDTIKALNRHQRRRLIRFRGDGSGSGIRWLLGS